MREKPSNRLRAKKPANTLVMRVPIKMRRCRRIRTLSGHSVRTEDAKQWNKLPERIRKKAGKEIRELMYYYFTGKFEIRGRNVLDLMEELIERYAMPTKVISQWQFEEADEIRSRIWRTRIRKERKEIEKKVKALLLQINTASRRQTIGLQGRLNSVLIKYGIPLSLLHQWRDELTQIT